MTYCECAEWRENIGIVNTPWTLGLAALGEFNGIPFRYCPWCASPLTVDESYTSDVLFGIPDSVVE